VGVCKTPYTSSNLVSTSIYSCSKLLKKSEFWNIKRIKKIRNCQKSFVDLYSFIDILDISKQVSYSGYYSSLPSLRLQFDSEYLLNLLSYGVIGNTSDFGSEESRFETL
jgi:hypothetical protein